MEREPLDNERLADAKNPSTPAHILDLLAKDKDADVRACAKK